MDNKITNIAELEQKHNETEEYDNRVYQSAYELIHELEDDDLILRASDVYEEQLDLFLNDGDQA